MKKTIIIISMIFATAVAGNVQAEKLEKPVRLSFGELAHRPAVDPHVYNTINAHTAVVPDKNPMLDIAGNVTPLMALVTDDFAGRGGNGPMSLTAGNWLLANGESRYYLLGVGGPGRLSAGAAVNPEAEVTLSGFDTEDTYNIYVFSSLGKPGGTSDGMNRETVAVVTGMEELSDSVDATYNTSLLEFRNVQPTAGGTITLAFRAGANNNAVATSKGLPVEEQGLVCKDFYVNEVIVETAATPPTTTGLQKPAATETLRVTTEGITVLAADGLAQLRVVDMDGKTLFVHGALHDGLHIPLHFLTPGVFLVQAVGCDGETYTEKIMKR